MKIDIKNHRGFLGVWKHPASSPVNGVRKKIRIMLGITPFYYSLVGVVKKGKTTGKFSPMWEFAGICFLLASGMFENKDDELIAIDDIIKRAIKAFGTKGAVAYFEQWKVYGEQIAEQVKREVGREYMQQWVERMNDAIDEEVKEWEKEEREKAKERAKEEVRQERRDEWDKGLSLEQVIDNVPPPEFSA